jgi:hypothetical protein
MVVVALAFRASFSSSCVIIIISLRVLHLLCYRRGECVQPQLQCARAQ